MVRKFYDLAGAETGGNNIAALMAKSGVINETDNMVATPVEIPEIKAETSQTDGTPVATTTDLPAAETASPETPSQTETVVEPVKPVEVQAQEPVKPISLQEVLRNNQPEVILKELGFDDNLVGFLKEFKELDPKMVAFLNTWKTGGDIQAYVKEMSTDYTKMPAEEVMRHKLRQEYPNASERQLDILYRKEVAEKYNLQSDDETEAEEGRLLLEAKADKYRTDFTQRQQQFLLPKAPEPKADQPNLELERQKQEFEAYKSVVAQHDLTKNILATKQFSIGEGAEKFNFPVDPQGLTDLLYDSGKWAASLYNEDGSPKVEHQLLVAAVAKYGKEFLTEYAKHFKSLGGKAVIDPLENAKPVDGVQPAPTQAAPKNAAEAMARWGTFNNGGYR